MKTLGFRPCSRKVPFMKNGKLVIPDPDNINDYYQGYWWDKVEKSQVHLKPEMNENGEYADKDRYEYYYYLNENYHDN